MENTVNQRIKLLRTKLNLTQRDFADAIDSTLTTISRLENGGSTPQISTIKAIVRVFNVNKEWLLNGIGEIFENDQTIQFKPMPNGWKDEAFIKMEQLLAQSREEVAFYQRIIETLLPPSNSKESFQIASVGMGKILEFCDTSVRVAG